MKEYVLNQEEAKNALLFLDRVEIKGYVEASALLNLRNKLLNPREEEGDEKDESEGSDK